MTLTGPGAVEGETLASGMAAPPVGRIAASSDSHRRRARRRPGVALGTCRKSREMSIRKLSVDFAFYGMLDLLQRSIGLIMVPLYTRVLSQQEYGDLDILFMASAAFLVLVDLQFLAAFSRLYLEYFANGRGRRFVGTILGARLLGGVLLPAGFVAAGLLGWADLRFLPSFTGNETAWILVLATVPPSLAYDVLLLQSRMLRRKRTFAAGALSNTVISCLLSVLFVTVWRWGTVGVIAGLLLGKVAGLALLAWDLRKDITLCLDREILRPLAAYALPLIPGWWLAFGSASAGRFFIYGIQGADQNAILAVCVKIAGAIGLFSISFRSAWQPLAMAHIGGVSGEAFYVRSMRLFMAGGLFSICGLAACLPLILTVLAPGSYGIVEVYFPLIAVGTLIGECESNLQLGNQIAKRTGWISFSSVVSVVVNLAVLIAFTAKLGIFAAGFGLLVSSLSKVAVTYTSGQRNWPIAYDTRAFIVLGAGCAALLVLGAVLQHSVIPGWMPRAGMAAVGVVAPWLILDSSERRLVLATAAKYLPAGASSA